MNTPASERTQQPGNQNPEPFDFSFQFYLQIDPAHSDELPRRFRGIAYSGGVIPNYGRYGDAAIDLATVSFNYTLTLLVNHHADQVAGKCRLLIVNHQLAIEGEFSRVTEHAKHPQHHDQAEPADGAVVAAQGRTSGERRRQRQTRHSVRTGAVREWAGSAPRPRGAGRPGAN